MLYRSLLGLLRWLFSRLFVIEVNGREHVPTGRYLLVSNHINWIDPFILLTVLPDEPRVHFTANQEATFNRWWKRAILGAVGGVIPLTVGSRRSHEEVLTRTCAVLWGGGVCGIFPEGRISLEEGKLLPFMNGVGHLAIRGMVPSVPIALAGTSDLYLRRRITVTFGEVVPLAEESLALKLRAEATVRHVRDAMEAMLFPYEEPTGVVKR